MENYPPQLKRLERNEEAAAAKASDLAKRCAAELQGEILRLSRKLNISGSASAREAVEKAIRGKIATLQGRLVAVLQNAMAFAEQEAGKAAPATGVTAASAKRARDLHSIIQGNAEKLAAVFTRNMEENTIDALRNATVSAIVEANTAGMTMRQQAKLTREKWEEATDSITDAVFVDRAGNEWDTGRYMQMNIRTNAMRAYNDNLANNLAADGRDLAMISTGGDPHCKKCYPWEGRIVSISGKTPGFPTYEDALAAGLFHPNCTHTLEPVDEDLDEEEIALQRGQPSPVDAQDGDEAQAQAYALEIERNQAAGLTRKEAEIAAKRKRLKDAARNGMPVEGSDAFIDNLSDAEINTLTDGTKVPHFALARRDRPAGYTRSTVVFPRDEITADALRDMKGFDAQEEETESTGNAEKRKEETAKEEKPKELTFEQKQAALIAEIRAMRQKYETWKAELYKEVKELDALNSQALKDYKETPFSRMETGNINSLYLRLAPANSSERSPLEKEVKEAIFESDLEEVRGKATAEREYQEKTLTRYREGIRDMKARLTSFIQNAKDALLAFTQIKGKWKKLDTEIEGLEYLLQVCEQEVQDALNKAAQ